MYISSYKGWWWYYCTFGGALIGAFEALSYDKADYESYGLFDCSLIIIVGIFDVKDALCTGRPIVENFDKIIEIIEVYRHVSSRSIAQELKIDHKTILSHFRKAGFKRKLHV
ncbi:histone-lysine N-methyltransferase SETMAR [Trichonephila clavipes]|nr:histone-lysine N-methyltransferase SETMAR [Trichonephila clavipes]